MNIYDHGPSDHIVPAEHWQDDKQCSALTAQDCLQSFWWASLGNPGRNTITITIEFVNKQVLKYCYFNTLQVRSIRSVITTDPCRSLPFLWRLNLKLVSVVKHRHTHNRWFSGYRREIYLMGGNSEKSQKDYKLTYLKWTMQCFSVFGDKSLGK